MVRSPSREAKPSYEIWHSYSPARAGYWGHWVASPGGWQRGSVKNTAHGRVHRNKTSFHPKLSKNEVVFWKRDACAEHFHITVPTVSSRKRYLIFGTRMSLMKTRVTSTVGQCICLSFSPSSSPVLLSLAAAGITAWNCFQPCEWGHCLSLDECLILLRSPRRKGSCKNASSRIFLTSKVQVCIPAAYGTSRKASRWQHCHLGQTAKAYPMSKSHHLVLPSLIFFSAKLICSGFSAIPDGLCSEKLKRQISGEIYNIENDQNFALQ